MKMEVRLLKYANFSKERKRARNCMYGWSGGSKGWGRGGRG